MVPVMAVNGVAARLPEASVGPAAGWMLREVSHASNTTLGSVSPMASAVWRLHSASATVVFGGRPVAVMLVTAVSKRLMFGVAVTLGAANALVAGMRSAPTAAAVVATPMVILLLRCMRAPESTSMSIRSLAERSVRRYRQG